MTESSNAAQTAASTDVATSRIEHETWCQRHEYDDQGGWCVSRAIPVAGTIIEVSTGTLDGSAGVYGLDEMERAGQNGFNLETAEQIARAVLELVEEARAARVTACYRPWCVMGDIAPEEHDDHHSSDIVDLTNPPDVHVETGYWAWLVERVNAGEGIKVAFEGRPELDCDWDRFELDILHLDAIIRILDDPRGRAGIEQLLRWFD